MKIFGRKKFNQKEKDALTPQAKAGIYDTNGIAKFVDVPKPSEGTRLSPGTGQQSFRPSFAEYGKDRPQTSRANEVLIEEKTRAGAEIHMMRRKVNDLETSLDEMRASHQQEIQKCQSEFSQKNALAMNYLQRIKRSDTLRIEATAKTELQAQQLESMGSQMDRLNQEKKDLRANIEKRDGLLKHLDRDLAKLRWEQAQRDEQSLNTVLRLEAEVEEAIRYAATKEEDLQRTKREKVAQYLESLNQKDRRISVLEQEVRDRAEILQETRLTLNCMRNELDVEKRKTCRAVGENDDKARQLEFVQQQCAILQEKITMESWGGPPRS